MKIADFKNLIIKKRQISNIGNSAAWPITFIRDWKIIVLAFAIGLISLSAFAWQIYLSDQIAGGYLAPSVENMSLSVKTVDIKKLNADLLMLQTRQADYLKSKANPVKMVDPSL